MKILGWIALILVIVGALNWGLVGIFEYNIVDEIFGAGSTAARTVYGLVGLSGLFMIGYAIYAAAPTPTFRGGRPHIEQH
ncbi:MAG: DUF378 domain-containing protein [Thermoleophilia bacterium]|nr:DUF378 domain-containing protein [Thermoleophilia bacterium]